MIDYVVIINENQQLQHQLIHQIMLFVDYHHQNNQYYDESILKQEIDHINLDYLKNKTNLLI